MKKWNPLILFHSAFFLSPVVVQWRAVIAGDDLVEPAIRLIQISLAGGVATFK